MPAKRCHRCGGAAALCWVTRRSAGVLPVSVWHAPLTQPTELQEAS